MRLLEQPGAGLEETIDPLIEALGARLHRDGYADHIIPYRAPLAPLFDVVVKPKNQVNGSRRIELGADQAKQRSSGRRVRKVPPAAALEGFENRVRQRSLAEGSISDA